jgi:hypothetical protein
VTASEPGHSDVLAAPSKRMEFKKISLHSAIATEFERPRNKKLTGRSTAAISPAAARK